MNNQQQIIIIGGGMVGLGCALALSQSAIQVTLLESQATMQAPQSSADDRTLVVNPAAIEFWQTLNIWPNIEPKTVPITKVHVSNQGQFGSVIFDAKQQQVERLGAVVAAKQLAWELWQTAKRQPNLTLLENTKLLSFSQRPDGVEINCQTAEQKPQKLKAAIMIAADGANSDIRQQLKLKTQTKDYQRQVIVTNLQTEKPHQNCAYERLSKTGPLALLPFHNNRCGMVWSVDNEHLQQLLQADENDFLKQAQQAFSYRLGTFSKLGKRSHYPLYQIKVPQQVAGNIVLLGNAAHTVSPVSAQGLNLAVRGIKRLTDILSTAKQDLSNPQLLQHYQQQSKADQIATLNYTDDLMKWFQIDSPPINALRSLGLILTDSINPIKNHLFKRAGGLKA